MTLSNKTGETPSALKIKRRCSHWVFLCKQNTPPAD